MSRSSKGNVRRTQKNKRTNFGLPSIFRKKAAMAANAEDQTRVGANKVKKEPPKKEIKEKRTFARKSVSGVNIGIGYILMMLVVMLAWAGSFVYHLHIRFEGIRLGYETSRAQSLKTKLLLERRELRLELASLKEPIRVEEEARERLGMEMPSYEKIVVVGKKRKVVTVSGGAL